MPTIEDVEEQLSRIEGVRKLMSGRSIKELPRVLWEGETIEDATSGAMDGNNGLLVATNKRIIFVDKGLIGTKVSDIAYDKMSSLEYGSGVLFGHVKFFASGNRVMIDRIEKARVQPFAEGLRARISGAAAHASAQPPAAGGQSTAPVSAIEQVKQLAELRDQGILTDEEFQTKKKALLGL